MIIIGHLFTFIRTNTLNFMHNRLIYLIFSFLFIMNLATANVVSIKLSVISNNLWSVSLVSAIASCVIIWLGYRVMFLGNELSKLKQLQKETVTKTNQEINSDTSENQMELSIIHLENEKMKYQKLNRDKELANQTMDLIQKNKFLVKVTEELDKVNRLSSDESIKNKINTIIQKINKEIDNEKHWEVFETAFDDVHEDFLKRLKQKYPSLTPKELKLCAYLRLNISTKELAPLMNISIRGVEICRYRVRKKLDINRDESLTKMIMDL